MDRALIALDEQMCVVETEEYGLVLRRPGLADEPVEDSGDADLWLTAARAKWGYLPVVGPSGEEEPEVDGMPKLLYDQSRHCWRVADAGSQ